MKVLIIDMSQDGVSVAVRAQRDGHEVKLYCRPRGGKMPLAGKGMITRVTDWRPHMRWADLILMTGNSMYAEPLEPYFKQNFPIIGANCRAAALELDRGLGEEVLKKFGVPTIPSVVVNSISEAVAHVEKTGGTYAVKTWGGTNDKASSFVASSPADMIFRLQQWKRGGKGKGKLMLQEKMKGIEMATAAWFGPGGFSQPKREVFEEKKFLNEGLGQNTGEMGTIIRYVDSSLLFHKVLAPMEDYLHGLGYVGNVDVNCIIDSKGNPWPLEFTMRFGWPGYNLEMALHQGDSVEWLRDLWEGKDTLRVSPKICVGVLMAHGDFPCCRDPHDMAAGFPISGVTEAMERHVWPHGCMIDSAPVMKGDRVVVEPTLCTAEPVVMTVTGLGDTVEAAREKTYGRVWKIDWPNNRMFRTDIGCRLESQLPELQAFGYAKGMRYD